MIHRLVRGYDERIVRRLQRRELTGKYGRAGEMAGALRQPRRQQRGVRRKVHPSHRRQATGNSIAVALSQSRAGKYRIAPLVNGPGQRIVDASEPRFTVVIRQSGALTHLVDIPRGVEIVGVDEEPPEFRCQGTTDSGLARPGRAHEDDEH